MKFSWDENKRRKVRKEHKVDFVKIVDVFDDPFVVEYIDEEYSTNEEIRFAVIGATAEYGLVYLVYTESNENDLRFITARKAENWMVKFYDKRRSKI